MGNTIWTDALKRYGSFLCEAGLDCLWELIVAQVPPVHSLHAFLNVYLVMPAQCVQFAWIGEFAHGAVGFGTVEREFSLITYGVHNQFGQLADRDFLACADVDVAVANIFITGLVGVFEVYVLHNEYTGICHFFAPEEFAQWRAGSPEFDFLVADAVFGKYVQYFCVAVAAADTFYGTLVHVKAYGIPVALLQAVRQMHLTDHGGKHVAALQIEIVVGTVEVGGHYGNVVRSVLQIETFTHFQSGNLGNGIRLIGVFQRCGAGSDNRSMTTVAKKQADGTYKLSGQKTWVTMGEKLPYTIVVAKDEDPSRENRNMSLWYIPMDTPGVSTASLHKIGQQCIPFCEVYFDDVVVTEEQRMGKPGEGFMMLMKNFEVERSFIVAEQVGLAQAALEDAAKYANQRIAFGKPITKLQMIQEKLCDMEIKVQNTRNMLYKTLWKLDNGESVQLDSAMLKRYGCSECFQVADMALSIYAGLGYTTEVRIGRIWADLRGNMFGGGTHEVMAYIAGRQVAKKYAN